MHRSNSKVMTLRGGQIQRLPHFAGWCLEKALQARIRRAIRAVFGANIPAHANSHAGTRQFQRPILAKAQFSPKNEEGEPSSSGGEFAGNRTRAPSLKRALLTIRTELHGAEDAPASAVAQGEVDRRGIEPRAAGRSSTVARRVRLRKQGTGARLDAETSITAGRPRAAFTAQDRCWQPHR